MTGDSPGAENRGTFGSMPWGNTQDCMMCPFGLMFFALKNTKPEVMEHLTKAGIELALAFKGIIDAATERLGHQDKAEENIQRITIS